MSEELASRLARNIKHLRDARGLTQQQMAKLSGLPRATWANLESGAANPTLTVLHSVAGALQVSIEELISRNHAGARHYPRGSLPLKQREACTVSKLLPDKAPGMEIDRMELPRGGRFTGIPHTPGTREYLTCERGEITLTVGGETYRLTPGDVVVFRGDQRHGYANTGSETAVGYSVVLLTPVA
ncbi:MAG: XRE family transcriptional regulator [Myxococcota bacterium]